MIYRHFNSQMAIVQDFGVAYIQVLATILDKNYLWLQFIVFAIKFRELATM